MSDTTAAIRAAREVQAPTLAPELFRQSQEWFLKARQAYHLKEFKEATEYAEKARYFAEQAELEAVRSGASRESINVPPPPPPPPPSPSGGGGGNGGGAASAAPEQGFGQPFNDGGGGDAGGGKPPAGGGAKPTGGGGAPPQGY
ncbi:MAG TPA: hypothetical protein VL588_07310 [Bdellovibrionota bacterium]|nr:hypothetical protein [Bdellovibrionota bacterium]